jgi:hypothetical protein
MESTDPEAADGGYGVERVRTRIDPAAGRKAGFEQPPQVPGNDAAIAGQAEQHPLPHR